MNLNGSQLPVILEETFQLPKDYHAAPLIEIEVDFLDASIEAQAFTERFNKEEISFPPLIN